VLASGRRLIPAHLKREPAKSPGAVGRNSALATLEDVQAAGARLEVGPAGLAVHGEVPPELRGRLIRFKTSIVAILAGRRCPRCLQTVGNSGKSAGIALPDGTRVHLTCLGRSER
jgi:hypothetical protein